VIQAGGRGRGHGYTSFVVFVWEERIIASPPPH